MGFWSELKELGRDIGGDFAQLGNELKQIGKDTVEEIKQDPTKYFLDSAKEIAEGGAKLAVGGAKFALRALENAPNVTLRYEQKFEEMYQAGKMTPEQAEKYKQRRRRAFFTAKDYHFRLLSREIPGDLSSEEVFRQIELLKSAQVRMKWYLSLPKLDIDDEISISVRNSIEEMNGLIAQLDRTASELKLVEEKHAD